MSSDVAVVHENYFSRGGSEVVAEHLAKTFDAPLYLGFSDESVLPDDPDIKFVSLFDDRLVARWKHSRYVKELYSMWAWQHVPELHEYDVVIQSGTSTGWYVPPDDQVVVRYVHTPPRILYDMFPELGGDTVTRLYAMLMRVLYQPNLPYAERYVANSELVARRIRKYWGIENVDVVYPPVEMSNYGPQPSEEFYLTYSRLSAPKRIGEIVEAFNQLPDKQLIVGGSGPEADRLRSLANENVEFRGFLSESEKRDLLGRAKALVFAAHNEDFGIVPVEAFASGTPVIGVRDGYTEHHVRDGVNGVLFDRGADSLAAAVERFEREGVELSAIEIESMAERYSLEAFERRIRAVVDDAVEASTVEPQRRD